MAASEESGTLGKESYGQGRGTANPLPIGCHTFPHTNTVSGLLHKVPAPKPDRVKGKGGHYPHLQGPGTIRDTGYSEEHSGAHVPR